MSPLLRRQGNIHAIFRDKNLPAVSDVRIMTSIYTRSASLLSRAAGGAFSPKVKYPGTLPEQLSYA